MTNLDPGTSAYNEDTLMYAKVGRPSRAEHILQPSRPSKNFGQDVWAAGDIFVQPDMWGTEIAKYAFKGALAALIFSAGFKHPLKTFSQLTLRKVSKHVDENTFGRLQVYLHLLAPDVITGAALGAGYFVFFHLLWKEDASESPAWKKTIGGSIFGTVAFASLFGPRMWWAGLYAGAFFGFFQYYWARGNNVGTRGTIGSAIKIPGMTDEQRKRQAEKDYIHQLSLELPFKYDTLKDL